MSSATAAPTRENVLYEKKGAIAYVTLNRPKVLNALNKATIAELNEVFKDARDDAAVRGVILTGAGDKAFAAGADISEMANDTPAEAEDKTRHGQRLTAVIENLGKPVIAAVNGFALGGGCELAMACTIRLAVETAKFGQPEVTIGIIPGYGGTQRLPRLVGKGRALQLILTGDMIDAQEAYRIGLVNEIVAERQPHSAGGSHPEQDQCERPDRGQAGDRRREPGSRREPRRRPEHRGVALRPVCRHRGHERGRRRVPREAQAEVPGPVTRRARTRPAIPLNRTR